VEYKARISVLDPRVFDTKVFFLIVACFIVWGNGSGFRFEVSGFRSHWLSQGEDFNAIFPHVQHEGARVQTFTPYTLIHPPETRNLRTDTRNSKPDTRNPKPETRNSKPETLTPSTLHQVLAEMSDVAPFLPSSSLLPLYQRTLAEVPCSTNLCSVPAFRRICYI